MKNPFTSKSSSQIAQSRDDVKRKLAQARIDHETAKEARKKLPFGTEQADLETVNAEIRAKADMVTALEGQLNEGDRLHREALAAEYSKDGPAQFGAICSKAAEVHQRALALSQSIKELVIEQDKLKQLSAPLHAVGKAASVLPQPIAIAVRQRKALMFARTNAGPAPHEDAAASELNSFLQNRSINVGADYEKSETAKMLETTSALTVDSATPKAA